MPLKAVLNTQDVTFEACDCHSRDQCHVQVVKQWHEEVREQREGGSEGRVHGARLLIIIFERR